MLSIWLFKQEFNCLMPLNVAFKIRRRYWGFFSSFRVDLMRLCFESDGLCKDRKIQAER